MDGILAHRYLSTFLQASLAFRRYLLILPDRGGHCENKACLADKHNTMTQPGLEPRSLEPESIAQSVRPCTASIDASTVTLEITAYLFFRRTTPIATPLARSLVKIRALASSC